MGIGTGHGDPYLVNALMPRLGSKVAKVKLKEIGGSLYQR